MKNDRQKSITEQFEFPASLRELTLSTNEGLDPKWFTRCTELEYFSLCRYLEDQKTWTNEKVWVYREADSSLIHLLDIPTDDETLCSLRELV